MNAKEYIASGMVESYVLGLLSEAERAEFEATCAQQPEVAAARDSFEAALEAAACADAPQPPAFIKERLKSQLFTSPVVQEEGATVVEMTEPAPVRRLNPWKWMAAASLALLAGSLFWGYTQYKGRGEDASLAEQNRMLQAELKKRDEQLASLGKDIAPLQNPAVKMAALRGTPTAPGSRATVYWDTTSKDVYLLINNMPKPASDQQYQLWALMGNQPIDLGTFTMTEEKMVPMIKVKGVERAEAFAITLEPKGGSATPTLEQMQVLGKL